MMTSTTAGTWADLRRTLCALLLVCAGIAGFTNAQSAATAPLVDVAALPLYSGRQAHPNVVVSTSVEYPTVRAAYNAISYLTSSTYLGYFDSSKCYVYDGDDGGFFRVDSLANANHECIGAFSGNFMNWLTMSAVDEFRYALTGGNRTNENGPNQGTIVDRAYLPDGDLSSTGVPNFYASDTYFRRHELNGGAVDGVPSSVATALIQSPGNSQHVFATNCGIKVYFRLAPDGNCASTTDAGGTAYNVRINVCDRVEGPLRPDLCLQYGGSTGRYKPVGQAQQNASRVRFASFGYLMDRDFPGSTSLRPTDVGYSPPYSVAAVAGEGCVNTHWNRCRYGGVLRSPMKYLGSTQYDANLVPAVNLQKEVNDDGTLVVDPEGTASSAGGAYSGFINFINKFGSDGVYKAFDPGGEMFYEAIRYYQHLEPTDLATTGTLTNSVKGFYPVSTAWADPLLSTCSANYIINLSDANTWDDTYLPGYNGSPANHFGRPASRPVTGGLDAYAWTQNIGLLESTTSSLETNDVRPTLANLANVNIGANNSASYAAAGAAYWANVNDIRLDLPGVQTIKTISFDVAEDTPGLEIHDRQLFLMGKYGGFYNTIDRPQDAYANPFYGSIAASSTVAVRTNAEWEDSSGLAYPANYLLASDPQKLINGLRAAFARIGGPNSGTLAGASLTSSNLTYGSAGAYIASFEPLRWSGSVLLYSISADQRGNLEVSNTPVWDSGALLTARCGTVASASDVCSDTSTNVNKRNIVTTITVAGSRVATGFTNAGIAADAAYRASLDANPATGTGDGLGPQRLNYLRGYRADETSAAAFRMRDSPMGDIVNSGPVYVGPPTSAIPDADYQPFFMNNALREPAVYAGANDGMLHAFRASDGFELFAYVPGFERADLNALTSAGYQHDLFVDTVPKVQEARVNGTWKTILVGANGNGAQGIFGLDVTDPTTFGPGKVLFEFSDADDADFGSTLAAPEFAKLWVSGPATAPVYRYFAVVTGYNNARTVTGNNKPDPGISSDTANQGVLFLVALDHVLGTPWVLGNDYYKFKFPASNPALPNGLAPVTLLASKSGDRSTASMYFGDLQGNLWKFNTSTGNPATWASALGTATTPSPLFVAHDASGNRQPITARVELANGPFGSTLVFFGTGRYLGQTDLTLPVTATQSEYGLLDLNQSVAVDRAASLVPRTASVSGQNVTVTGASFSYSGASAKKGWYIDLPSVSVGERSVTKPAVRTGLLTFTTLTLSNDLCGPGNGFIYQVNALTGLAAEGVLSNVIGYTSTVGIPGPPRVVDLTLAAGQSQVTGEVINLKTQTTLVSGTANRIGSYGSQKAVKVPPTQQLSWREITNWNDRTGR